MLPRLHAAGADLDGLWHEWQSPKPGAAPRTMLVHAANAGQLHAVESLAGLAYTTEGGLAH